MKEVWKEIPGYPGYEVSSVGRVRSYRKSRGGLRTVAKYLRGERTVYGYLRATLMRDKVPKRIPVHRLVLAAFRGPPAEGYECAHLDGSRDNNSLHNLRWVTRKENHSHKRLHGTWQNGERAAMSRLTWAKVATIRHKHAQGALGKELARIYRVYPSTISKIVRGETWKTA